LKTDIAPSPLPPESIHYILSPVTGEADVEVNKLASGLNNPTVKISPRLPNIDLTLDQEQYKTILQSLDWFAQTQALKSNLKYRPHRRISDGESPRLWWDYAITAIRHVIREREEAYTLPFLTARREKRIAYARLFAKRELKIATPVEAQTLAGMEKELSVVDIKVFRTLTRRYLQMLRHEEPPLDTESELKREVWALVKDTLGDITVKEVDSAPSPGGWLSMFSWGGGSAKKEDPRWEESAGEVAYVVGWTHSEDELSSSPSPLQSPRREVHSSLMDAQAASSDSVPATPEARPATPKTSSDLKTPETPFRPRTTQPSTQSNRGDRLPESPQSYAVMAAKALAFGIDHISPYPTNANEFLLLDIRMLKGSLTLRRGRNEHHTPLASTTFNGFRPVFRLFTFPNEENAPPTWVFTSTLAKLLVTDESLPTSKFKKIVQAPRPSVDDGRASVVTVDEDLPASAAFDSPDLWENPLLFLNAAQLAPKTGYDKRVEIRLEESLIFYHKGFVEEIVRFFKPPDKHETLNALFDAMMEATREYASETMDSLRTAEAPMSRTALEFAITESRANLIEMHLKAPLIIFPEE